MTIKIFDNPPGSFFNHEVTVDRKEDPEGLADAIDRQLDRIKETMRSASTEEFTLHFTARMGLLASIEEAELNSETLITNRTVIAARDYNASVLCYERIKLATNVPMSEAGAMDTWRLFDHSGKVAIEITNDGLPCGELINVK